MLLQEKALNIELSEALWMQLFNNVLLNNVHLKDVYLNDLLLLELV